MYQNSCQSACTLLCCDRGTFVSRLTFQRFQPVILTYGRKGFSLKRMMDDRFLFSKKDFSSKDFAPHPRRWENTFSSRFFDTGSETIVIISLARLTICHNPYHERCCLFFTTLACPLLLLSVERRPGFVGITVVSQPFSNNSCCHSKWHTCRHLLYTYIPAVCSAKIIGVRFFLLGLWLVLAVAVSFVSW